MKARPKGPRKRRQSQKNKAEIKLVTNVALQRYAKIVLITEICEVKEKLSLSKFALERFSSNDDDIFFLHRISVLQSLHRIRELCQNECLVAT